MATEDTFVKTELGNIKVVKPGSPEHEQLLSVGYGGMTKEMALTIIAERKKDPASWPYEELKKAQAFLAALNAGSPKPTSEQIGTQGVRVDEFYSDD